MLVAISLLLKRSTWENLGSLGRASFCVVRDAANGSVVPSDYVCSPF